MLLLEYICLGEGCPEFSTCVDLPFTLVVSYVVYVVFPICSMLDTDSNIWRDFYEYSFVHNFQDLNESAWKRVEHESGLHS